MKKKSAAPEKSSRRAFAKSVATALVVSPLAFSRCDDNSTNTSNNASNNSNSSSRTTTSQASPSPLPSEGVAATPDSESNPPPIIVTGGSFHIESDEDLEFEGMGGTGPGGRARKKYKRKQPPATPDVFISCVVVRKNKGGPVLFCERFDPRDCYIEIYWNEDTCKRSDGSPCPKA